MHTNNETGLINPYSLTIEQLRHLAIFARRGRETNISTSLNSIISNILSNRPIALYQEILEINQNRNCRKNLMDPIDTTMRQDVASIIAPSTNVIHPACFNCDFGAHGIVKDLRRSRCAYLWDNLQKLIHDLSDDNTSDRDEWPSYKLPGSPGYVYINQNKKLDIGVNLEEDPSDFRFNCFGGDSWIRKMGVIGFNIGRHRFIKNSYLNPMNINSNPIILQSIPYEIVSYPNQFYSLATAACIASDEENFRSIPTTYITDIGSGTGYLGLLASELSNNPFLYSVELDKNYESELRSNILLNGMDNKSGVLMKNIMDVRTEMIEFTTHLIANFGTHYGQLPFDRIMNLIQTLPNLQYVCMGGFNERDSSLRPLMSRNGFETKSICTAPMVYEIANQQRVSSNMQSSNSFEGFVSMSFIKRR